MIEEAAVCWMEAASVRRRARGGPRFLRLAVAAEMTAGVRTKRAVPAIVIVAVGVIVLLQQ